MKQNNRSLGRSCGVQIPAAQGYITGDSEGFVAALRSGGIHWAWIIYTHKQQPKLRSRGKVQLLVAQPLRTEVRELPGMDSSKDVQEDKQPTHTPQKKPDFFQLLLHS